MWTFFWLILLALTSFAQEAPAITADNIRDLQPVRQIELTEFPEVNSGWFTMSNSYIAVVRQDGGLIIFDLDGEMVDTYALTGDNGEPATVLDARFDANGERVTAVHTDGESFFVSIHEIGGETLRINYPAEMGIPVRVWFDVEQPYIWLEAMPADADDVFQVVRLPLAEDQEIFALPNAPELDTESFIRIGRIPAPLAITATFDGLIKLWDLQTGDITASVQLDGLPVFGRINEMTGKLFTWRDGDSSALHVLDFETGENTLVTPLDGAYIQALMLSPVGDVVLAVHIGEDPIVVAWETATGERIDLGTYRTCSRVPDAVQLSADGTTLVIGCDTGLELWQVGES